MSFFKNLGSKFGDTKAKLKKTGNNKKNQNNSKQVGDDIPLSSEFNYLYKNRRCSYRNEQLEISPNEYKKINNLISKSIENISNYNKRINDSKYDNIFFKQILNLFEKSNDSSDKMRIIVDTDLGTDIDDVFTILTLIHMLSIGIFGDNDKKQTQSFSRIEVLGITTNYRPTLIRKYIIDRLLSQASKTWNKMAVEEEENKDKDLSNVFDCIPVIAGCNYLCGTHRPCFYAGNEGCGVGIGYISPQCNMIDENEEKQTTKHTDNSKRKKNKIKNNTNDKNSHNNNGETFRSKLWTKNQYSQLIMKNNENENEKKEELVNDILKSLFYFDFDKNKDNNNTKTRLNSLECGLTAEEFIFQQCTKYPKKVTIVSIGIPTNIGRVIKKYGQKSFEEIVGHIVVMGGGNVITHRSGLFGAIGQYYGNKSKKWKDKSNQTSQEMRDILDKHPFKLPQDETDAMKWASLQHINNNDNKVKIQPVHFFPNHNLSGDTLASSMMFDLNVPISVIPHHITSKHILRGKAIETLLQLGKNCQIIVSKHLLKLFLMNDKNDWNLGLNENILNDKVLNIILDYLPRYYFNNIFNEFDCNENGLSAILMISWFAVRRKQRVQCLHDPLTLYEALFPIDKKDETNKEMKQENTNEDDNDDNDNKDGGDFMEGFSSLSYCFGTFICHEWASFLTFIPDIFGPHRLAYKCKNAKKFVEWTQDIMIDNVPQEKQTDDAGDYKTIVRPLKQSDPDIFVHK